jgi:hypothetical protein
MSISKTLWKRKFEICTLFVILMVCYATAARIAIYIPTNHVDGAFQTASGLFRIKQADVPGIDFFPYLGLGPLLMLAPIFFGKGADLAASVFASNITTLMILVFGMTVTLYFFRIKKLIARQILLWSTLPLLITVTSISNFLTSTTLLKYFGFESLLELSSPGNSLKPLRAFVAWFLPVIVFFVLKKFREQNKAHILLGVILASNLLLWSNDYAIASTAMTIILYWVLQKSLNIKVKKTAKYFSVSFLITALLIVAILNSRGWNNSLIKYNYVDVRKDQFWYFEPWARSTRILSITDFYHQLISEKVLFPIIVLVCLMIYARKKPSIEIQVLITIGVILFAGGAISTIGGHTAIYFYSFKLWGLLVLLSSLIQGTYLLKEKINLKKFTFRNFSTNIVLLLLCFSFLFYSINNFRKEQDLAQGNKLLVLNEELGGYINALYDKKIDNPDANFLEEYAGLRSIINGYRSNVRVDSVIHALGSERKVFEKAFESKPEVVITSSPYVGEWFRWSISANWWFYRHLFKEYTPSKNSPTTLIWNKGSVLAWPSRSCNVTEGGQGISIGAKEDGLYDVEIGYKGPGNLSRSFSVIQNNISYVGDARGFLSLNPAAKSQSFIAAGIQGGTTLKLMNVSSVDKELTEIEFCRANLITYAPESNTEEYFTYLFKPESTPFNLTDSNWIKGVSRVNASFFVTNSYFNRNVFKVNSLCQFQTGEQRIIVRVLEAGPYLNVFLSGDKLNPNKVGNPKQFKILENK